MPSKSGESNLEDTIANNPEEEREKGLLAGGDTNYVIEFLLRFVSSETGGNILVAKGSKAN